MRLQLVAALLLAPLSPGVTEEVDVCGVLYAHSTEPDCFTFSRFDNLESYEIENVGSFESDDIVRVKGEVVEREQTCRFGSDRRIVNNEIAFCEPESLGCGVLRDRGEGCWMWESDSLGVWLTVRPAGFGNGEALNAVGYREYHCFNVCMFGEDGCLVEPVFARCTTPIKRSTWGRLKSLYR